ncbi:lipopolysaccharide biosynthesis protein [Acinetobacter haemolyticus]|uniref:lipopolysaccharide biosynthesis protein n=1 Tax=Acinetobacter haemolyticus TaxID=29430 RepID=UPI000D6986FF|nr:oligosaccharide flippase family protein [Acinetobacter haemolyticus]
MKSFLDKVNAKLNAQGGFLKSISMLIGGTAFAHAITVLALPFITRLYTPEDFSQLAIYTSLLGIFSVVACLRYEIAIPLPESDTEADSLLVISIINSTLFAIFLTLVLNLFSISVENALGNNYFPEILWLLPLGVWAASLYSAFKFWSTRVKDFKSIAQTKIQQSTSSVVTQLGLGYWGYTSVGLLLGQFLYNSAGVFSLIKKRIKYKKISFNNKNILKTYSAYNYFPKYSVGEALFNSAGVHLPILFIAAIAESKEAGYLLLASKIMIIPMVLIGASVSQVYYAHANEAKNENRLSEFTQECMVKLAKIGIAPILFVGMVAPVFFPLLFGQEWERAGILVAWMTPWFILQFIVSPVSMSLHVISQQKLALVMQLIGLLLKLSLVGVAVTFYQDKTSELYAISGFIFYLLYFLLILYSIHIGGSRRADACLASLASMVLMIKRLRGR